MNEVNVTQVGGSHYKGTTYQHWDFVQAVLGGRYLEGNITKYVTRHRKKNGLEDLRKARHYLTKLMDEHNVGNVTPLMHNHRLPPHQRVDHFCDVNGIDINERNFIVLISNWHSRADLRTAAMMLDAIIEHETYRDEEARGAIDPDDVEAVHNFQELADDSSDSEAGDGYVNQD